MEMILGICWHFHPCSDVNCSPSPTTRRETIIRVAHLNILFDVQLKDNKNMSDVLKEQEEGGDGDSR